MSSKPYVLCYTQKPNIRRAMESRLNDMKHAAKTAILQSRAKVALGLGLAKSLELLG